MVQKKFCVYLYISTYHLCVCVYRERAPRICRNEQTIKQMRQNVNGRYIQISFFKKILFIKKNLFIVSYTINIWHTCDKPEPTSWSLDFEMFSRNSYFLLWCPRWPRTQDYLWKRVKSTGWYGNGPLTMISLAPWLMLIKQLIYRVYTNINLASSLRVSPIQTLRTLNWYLK